MASNVAAEEPSSYGGEIALPPDVWASVLEFVPFQTRLLSTSRFLLQSVSGTSAFLLDSSYNMSIQWVLRDATTLSYRNKKLESNGSTIILDVEAKVGIMP